MAKAKAKKPKTSFNKANTSFNFGANKPRKKKPAGGGS